MDKFLKVEDIDTELTAKVQKEKKYLVFLEWLRKNGALIEGIEYPAVFGSYGYVGVASKEKIPPNKTVLAIPNKLIISPALIETGGLKEVIKDAPQLFSTQGNVDSDLNKMTLFMMTEKIKGEKSFWAPYLNIQGQEFSLLDWTEKEVEGINDVYLFQQFKEYKVSVEDKWKQFLKVIVNYPNLISTDCCNKKLFLWCHECVSTHSISSNSPFMMMVPLADAFNHGKQTNFSLMFNRAFEQGKKKVHKNYILKNKFLDFSIFKQIAYKQEDLDQLHKRADDKKAYVFVNAGGRYNKQYLEDVSREQIRNNILLINAEKLKARVKNLWEMPFFTTSESDDIHGEDEEEEEEGEEDFSSNSQYAELKAQEAIAASYNLQQQGEEIKFDEFEEYNKIVSSNNKPQSKPFVDSTWDWYDQKDEDVFYTVTVSKYHSQGKQIFQSYGRRDNRYLLLYYGFAVENNPYDCYPFRLWNNNIQMNTETLDISSIVFNEYLSYGDYDTGEVTSKQGKLISLDQLTKEFKLKKDSLSIDLFAFLRVSFLQANKNDNLSKPILVTLPSSLEFEKKVIDLTYKILWELKKRVFDRPIEEDIKDLNNMNLASHKRYATILKKEQKIIIQSQINAIKLLSKIISDLITNIPIGTAVSQKYDDLEPSETEYQENRQCIRHYISQLYTGIYKQKRTV